MLPPGKTIAKKKDRTRQGRERPVREVEWGRKKKKIEDTANENDERRKASVDRSMRM